jgi:hypothetical protein
LQQATDRQDETAEHRILQIIKGKKERKFWQRLNWALDQCHGNSVQTIQVEQEDGTILEYSSQSQVQSVIWQKIHQNHYHLAKEAQICKGRLRGELGYNAMNLAGNAVLTSNYPNIPGYTKAQGYYFR